MPIHDEGDCRVVEFGVGDVESAAEMSDCEQGAYDCVDFLRAPGGIVDVNSPVLVRLEFRSVKAVKLLEGMLRLVRLSLAGRELDENYLEGEPVR